MKGLTRLSGQSLGLKMIRFFLGIGSAALLTRLMSLHDYGIYAYALVIATLLAIPGEAGMPNLVMREIARAKVDQDKARIRGIVLFANATVLALTLGIVVIAGLVLWIAQDRIPPIFRWTLIAVMPAILFGALANTRAGVQRALGDPISSQLPEQIIRPAALILFVAATWVVLRRPLDPVEGIVSYVLASGTAFVAGVMLFYRTWKTTVGPGPATVKAKPLLLALVPFSAISALQVAGVQISALILGLTASPSEIATFRIATLGSDFALFSTLAINSLVAPQFAELMHKGDTQALTRLVRRVNLINVAFALTVVGGIVVLGPWGLRFAFGPAYLASYVPMILLALGHLFGSTMGYVSTLANMSGRERLTLIGAICGVACNLVLSLLLCPRYGAVGAAISASVTAVLWRVMVAILLYRRTGVRAWGISIDAAIAKLRRIRADLLRR